MNGNLQFHTERFSRLSLDSYIVGQGIAIELCSEIHLRKSASIRGFYFFVVGQLSAAYSRHT